MNEYKFLYRHVEGVGFWGVLIDVPGAISQGKTIEELKENLGDAAKAILFLERKEVEANFKEDGEIFEDSLTLSIK